MESGLNIGSTGMKAAQQRLEGVAQNQATRGAAERSRVRVENREGMHGGVEGQFQQAGEAGSSEAVDGAVEQIAAASQLKASARAVQTRDEMLGTLLDLET